MILNRFPRLYPKAHALPLIGSITEEFITWSHKRGFGIYAIRHALQDLVTLDRFFRRRGIQNLCDLSHNSFEKAYSHYHRPYYHNTIPATIRQVQYFFDKTGRLAPCPPQPMIPIKLELNRIADYLQHIRGFSTGTIQNYRLYLPRFLKYIDYNTNTKALTMLTSKKIEDFLSACSKRYCRKTLQGVGGILRNFLKFQYEQGVLSKPLYRVVDTPRIYKNEKLPRSLPKETVKAFLHSINRTNSHGIRDYTMFFLTATYGLRRSEIAGLTLDDINLRDGTLRVLQKKTKTYLILPLINSIKEVLIKYLTKSRPNNLPYRELFLRLNAPNGPFTPRAVTSAFRLRIRLSGLNIPVCGPHSLRHSHVVRLIKQGISIKTISDLIGHQSLETTNSYARLNIEDLREVALPVPHGPSITTPLEIRIERLRNRSAQRKKMNLPPIAPKAPTILKSFLRKEIQNYIKFKRALGLKFGTEACTLHWFDDFLAKRYPRAKDLTGEMFNQWCRTISHLNLQTRRKRMYHIRQFCVYRTRSHLQAFVPDSVTFPDPKKQPFIPYIVSESEVARLMRATQYIRYFKGRPLRPQIIRLGILLTYTCGLRLGDLIGLKLSDYDLTEKTLFIRKGKFGKDRVLPLSPSVAEELNTHLELRRKNNLPMDITAPLMWSGRSESEEGGYTASGFKTIWSTLRDAVNGHTKMRSPPPPRLHDLRHSFATNNLERWYKAGEDPYAKLPSLCAYMGHATIKATAYYLSFVEGIRSEASKRFQKSFGSAITVINPKYKKMMEVYNEDT